MSALLQPMKSMEGRSSAMKKGRGGGVPSLQLLGVFHNDHLKGVVALGSGSVHVPLQGLWVSALRGQLMGGLSTYQSVSE